MSRLKNLKSMKIRKINKLKTTIKCLSLTLIVSFTQVLGTYALFTESIDVSSDISISLGDVDVEASEGFYGKEIDTGNKSITKEFTITNNGTINQTLSIQLDIPEINDSILEKISYKLQSNDKVKKFDDINEKMNILKNNSMSIMQNNSITNLILAPQETLNCKATISINDEKILSSLSGNKINFNLYVRAEQVGWKEQGFYDVFKQSNNFSIQTLPEVPIVPEDTGVSTLPELSTVSEETIVPEDTGVSILPELPTVSEDTQVPIENETPQISENADIIPPKKEDETTL